MHQRSIVIGFVMIVISALACKNNARITRTVSDSIDASIDPIQEYSTGETRFALLLDGSRFMIKPFAIYQIHARVVGKKYYSSGWQGDIAPIDVALVWGKLAEQKYDRFIRYSQSGRWYAYHYLSDCPLDNDYISRHSSNNHLIPATKNIQSAFDRIRTNDLVMISGYLVEIRAYYHGQEVWWNSSRSREDTGNDACELIYVTTLQINCLIFE